MNSRSQGSYEGWDNIWKGESDSDKLNPHFLKDNSKTIYQFLQKAYARDLINLIKNKEFKVFCEIGSGRCTTSMCQMQVTMI